MSIGIFEYATRNKIRFPSSRGDLTLEQLWDVPLRATDGFDLNAVARAANKAWKEVSEENFVEQTRTPKHLRLEVALEVVKHVIDAKLADEAAAKKRAENRKERELLLAALAEKQVGKMSEMTEQQIRKRIAQLGSEKDEV